jgi:hypothetical protein
MKSRRTRNIQGKAHISAGVDPVKDMGAHVHMITFKRSKLASIIYVHLCN